jgi:hypothetical protein
VPALGGATQRGAADAGLVRGPAPHEAGVSNQAERQEEERAISPLPEIRHVGRLWPGPAPIPEVRRLPAESCCRFHCER